MTSDRVRYSRYGSGEPLVLLHGLGDDRRTWDRVLPHLTEHFDTIAVDLPGHGASPRLPSGTEPNPQNLRNALGGLLDGLGIERAHLVGNSLGGWLALELAVVERARSLTLLSPAGLWVRERLVNRLSFPIGRALAGLPLSQAVAYTRLGRTLALAPVAARPGAIPVETAVATIAAIKGATGFFDTRRAVQSTRFRGGQRIDSSVPVTVAFGTGDRILVPGAGQSREELPPHARWISLERCGHVPMLDDPGAVAATILATALPTE